MLHFVPDNKKDRTRFKIKGFPSDILIKIGSTRAEAVVGARATATKVGIFVPP